ncbi:AraC family transcriptional regulator [Litoreibacter arenae]|uniref:Transcriptional regulator, AraC family n=1 Tax=Litoreibacter arenae DSM 19593 TaxID=1123360 RepID=S9RLP5_9RHOB|nr:AraC family transcriptional regulator [Litoreibacter arenae]EPX79035.1 Transcriptional regulator, AraC family [Litoreibacter arenae DSM 19593]
MTHQPLPKVETLATHQRSEAWRTDAAQSLDYPILFWITRGQGRIMVDCRMRGIGPNTAVFIPPHTLFSYEMFASPQGMVVSLPLDESAGFPKWPALLKATTVQMQSEITGLIDSLLRESNEERPGQRRAVMAYAMMLGVWLDRALADQPQGELGKSERVLRKFSHVVSIGHRDGKSLGEFAADLQVTPTHLTRLTQNAVGKPASALLQERVIQAACEALLHTDRPVQDIAEKLGFSSPAYFTRAFQTHTGKSPSAFRKSR